jgi:hypothetical protein
MERKWAPFIALIVSILGANAVITATSLVARIAGVIIPANGSAINLYKPVEHEKSAGVYSCAS